VVLPGTVAPIVLGNRLSGNWNATMPSMMLHYFNPSWVVIGVMGLAASLVSTFANNISGFSSAFVQGIYQIWIRPRQSDAHYLWMGRITNVAAIFLSIGAAYSALSYQSLMEYIQMVLSTFNAPIFALVALAALAPKRAAGGGLIGLLAGLGSAAVHQTLVLKGMIHYGSRMNANFYAAMLSFSVSALVTLVASWVAASSAGVPRKADEAERIPFYSSTPALVWAVVVSGVCIVVNVWLR
jgi:SSS family solute:Na+ symporter